MIIVGTMTLWGKYFRNEETDFKEVKLPAFVDLGQNLNLDSQFLSQPWTLLCLPCISPTRPAYI